MTLWRAFEGSVFFEFPEQSHQIVLFSSVVLNSCNALRMIDKPVVGFLRLNIYTIIVMIGGHFCNMKFTNLH